MGKVDVGSTTSRCSGNERPNTRERRKSSLRLMVIWRKQITAGCGRVCFAVG